MKGWSTLVCSVTIGQLQGDVLTNTKYQATSKSNTSTLVGNVPIRQLQRGILTYTKEQFMKEWSTPAGNVTIRQPQRAISQDTKEQFMQPKNIIPTKRKFKFEFKIYIFSNLFLFNCMSILIIPEWLHIILWYTYPYNRTSGQVRYLAQ